MTYEVGAGARVGTLDGDRVFDVGFDGDMVAFIAAGAPVGDTAAVENPRLLAPLRPRSLRDFLTFEGHLKNALSRLGRPIPEEWYEVPAYYKGLPDTVIGPEDEIPWPEYTDRLDHELELACIIGEQGKDISAARALEHVFGYTIWNDVSARDVQTRELPIGMGPAKAKDWDGSNVLGPCIVTADEVDPSALIAYASRAQTLYPGEVLGSGTATGGSGIEIDRWVAEGDVVELEVEGIGVLRNRIGKKGG